MSPQVGGSPPDDAVEAAIVSASRSPCEKTARGAAVYDILNGKICGVDHNGPPLDRPCLGGIGCRNVCGKICVHAEVRAIRSALKCFSYGLFPPDRVDMVHVKTVGSPRVILVGGGGPSCWQCSREILDSGIRGIWLLELICECDDVWVQRGGFCWRHGPKNGVVEWRYYLADEFHRETLRKCELPGG